MKTLLSTVPLSSTVVNNNTFINQKYKIINELTAENAKLEEKKRQNEFQIEQLLKEEKELKAFLGETNTKSLSRGFVNDFEIDKSELKIIGELGKGTFGVVSKGIWRKETVAVKFLKEEMLQQPENIKSFHEECLFLKNLRHPNILLFMGASTKSPDYFILTEMCEHGNLFDLLHHKKHITISWEDKRRLALELCYGMTYLHSLKRHLSGIS